MSKDKLKIERVLDLPSVIAEIESIAAALKAGSLTLHGDGQTLTVSPRPVVGLELSLSKKKDKEKLDIEISWRAPARQPHSGIRKS